MATEWFYIFYYSVYLLITSGSTFFSFHFVLCWPQLKHVRLERDCNTSLPHEVHTVNARGSVISLAGGFLSWHIPLWRHVIFMNIYKVKTGIRFLKESLLFWGINRVCRFGGFPWDLVRTFTDRYGTKAFCPILLNTFLWLPLMPQVTQNFR